MSTPKTVTPEKILEQFPCTGRPFAVWYLLDPDTEDNLNWCVNDKKGECCIQFQDIAEALKTAAEMGAEWDEEARKQRQCTLNIFPPTQSEIPVAQAGLPPDILEYFFDLRAMAMAASAMTIVIEENRSEFRDIDELNAMRRILTCLGNKALEFAEETELFLINSCNTQTTQDGKP